MKKATSIFYTIKSSPYWVIRKKHHSYSYWNYAAKKWYGDNDTRLYKNQIEITEADAFKIIQDNTAKFNQG